MIGLTEKSRQWYSKTEELHVKIFLWDWQMWVLWWTGEPSITVIWSKV